MSIFNSSNNLASLAGVNSDTAISGGNWVTDTYTGAGEKKDYEYVTVNLQTDEGGVMYFDFSQDGSNWSTFPVVGLTVTSGINFYHGAHKSSMRYFRPRFVGTGGRSYFRLATSYTNTAVALNSPLSQTVSNEQDATTVKAVIHGEDKDNAGSFVQGKMTSDGAIRTSIISALIDFPHDSYIVVDASTTTDRYDYYLGGLAGTKKAEILITYLTTGKNNVLSAEKTII
jgi:hypothetical protein